MRAENYQQINHPPSHAFELNFGPNHPGIEGNYALQVQVEGDTVVQARADGGYLHRGFEKLMEQRLWIQNIALVPRICVPDPSPMEVCYSMAVEQIAGIEVPERAQWIRVMQLELSRIAAHLFTFGGHAATTGMYSPMFWGVADRDLILDLFEEFTGGRIYSIYNLPGGVRRELPEGFLQRVTDTLDYIESRLPDYDDLFFKNRVFIKRAKGVGVTEQAMALEYGVTGPNLRAAGLPFDVRRDDPYLVYEQLEFEVPTEEAGDAWARTLVRRSELIESIRIVRQVVAALPDIGGPLRTPIPNPLAWRVPAGESYARVESSKGELAYYVVSDGSEKPWRVHVRGPSSMHAVQVLEELVKGGRIEDVAQTMFSLDACPPEVDR
ncbi:MAG: NADH-quinone oxidoreductase subunit D [Gammaproteobacteria bacterium]|jgi:NADH-quinone oxidoreductase subunit D|nr:NADH-quinone oxidoreductase subunit D [Gammaproteobacteria bacterium]MBT4606597.1 NADH-quinone oxidoreductase subunit D [Thiotrichales bacterium]MBT3471501.1 NADH-quinone oxidoreductase subunit D [Gammaproteobacteria bacterium]MBT4079245.1 NADH-quinone oxidoreductase subunit D [Gammaproteobacteria bacterium]MBT4329095.1 NADH-quinone oxidoreductase subunit D [Gammaproteobacteria bacterium]